MKYVWLFFMCPSFKWLIYILHLTQLKVGYPRQVCLPVPESDNALFKCLILSDLKNSMLSRFIHIKTFNFLLFFSSDTVVPFICLYKLYRWIIDRGDILSYIIRKVLVYKYCMFRLVANGILYAPLFSKLNQSPKGVNNSSIANNKSTWGAHLLKTPVKSSESTLLE